MDTTSTIHVEDLPIEKLKVEAQALRERTAAMLPPVVPLQSPRFAVDGGLADAMEYLDAHGYVVIAGVASEAELETSMGLLWDFLEGIGSGLQRGDVSTWGGQNWPADPLTGILGYYGIGQSKFQWFIRGLPAVKEVFTKIWQTDDLLVSFDGCGLFRPVAQESRWKTASGWFHVDQNGLAKKGRHCVQGLVALTPANPRTGGLCVIPGSHRHFDRIAQKQRPARDFVPIAVDDPVLQEGGRLVCCEAGDLLLWDSRTVHCNTPALEEPRLEPSQPPALQRAASYICMTPRSRATKEVLAQRREAYLQNITTTHWPHEYWPAHLAMEDCMNDLDALSPEQQRLI